MARRKRFTIYITDRERELLRTVSEREGRSMANYIAHAAVRSAMALRIPPEAPRTRTEA